MGTSCWMRRKSQFSMCTRLSPTGVQMVTNFQTNTGRTGRGVRRCRAGTSAPRGICAPTTRAPRGWFAHHARPPEAGFSAGHAPRGLLGTARCVMTWTSARPGRARAARRARTRREGTRAGPAPAGCVGAGGGGATHPPPVRSTTVAVIRRRAAWTCSTPRCPPPAPAAPTATREPELASARTLTAAGHQMGRARCAPPGSSAPTSQQKRRQRPARATRAPLRPAKGRERAPFHARKSARRGWRAQPPRRGGSRCVGSAPRGGRGPGAPAAAAPSPHAGANPRPPAEEWGGGHSRALASRVEHPGAPRPRPSAAWRFASTPTRPAGPPTRPPARPPSQPPPRTSRSSLSSLPWATAPPHAHPPPSWEGSDTFSIGAAKKSRQPPPQKPPVYSAWCGAIPCTFLIPNPRFAPHSSDRH
mmetsp:Transcript_25050/g.79406  ORF Transcript_25050/g.79406 Transcript_25050/m.79406 type:complete len:417 (-) Transcript_25050:87-1337(-)